MYKKCMQKSKHAAKKITLLEQMTIASHYLHFCYTLKYSEAFLLPLNLIFVNVQPIRQNNISRIYVQDMHAEMEACSKKQTTMLGQRTIALHYQHFCFSLKYSEAFLLLLNLIFVNVQPIQIESCIEIILPALVYIGNHCLQV